MAIGTPAVMVTPDTDKMAVCHTCGKELNIKDTDSPRFCLECKVAQRIK